jgi:hypothetical protein
MGEDYRLRPASPAGKDRRDMVERKLKRLYRSTPFTAQPLGVKTEATRRPLPVRRSDQPRSFQSWLRILTASGCHRRRVSRADGQQA